MRIKKYHESLIALDDKHEQNVLLLVIKTEYAKNKIVYKFESKIIFGKNEMLNNMSLNHNL